jgi:shikimate kinase
MKNIVLVGMMGCGKTTLGSIVAEKLGMTFIDMDVYIEKTMGTTITEMFKHGEPYFREIEAKTAKELSAKEGEVISTGGGIVKNPENISNLRENGIIIYLNRPVENIAADVEVESRPLLAKDPSQLFKIHEERDPLYKASCDFEVMNDCDIDTVVNKIIEIYKKASK